MSATKEQQNAIAARGKVIVSASAGAGKTTVMIKRLADIIEGGASLDEVLAVTFTKKAAAQMKTKLRTELIARLGVAEENVKEHLRAQLNKISAADISTIHAFCARLVRTYFYVLGVDAS
ncbi:MAG: UvrD-helicase domain-containing protein, partial [Clostridia bacterium]|nr:UvrD-helicase domain-containing protein [Clostridia bacterium]